jgi:hypothetical protein
MRAKSLGPLPVAVPIAFACAEPFPLFDKREQDFIFTKSPVCSTEALLIALLHQSRSGWMNVLQGRIYYRITGEWKKVLCS